MLTFAFPLEIYRWCKSIQLPVLSNYLFTQTASKNDGGRVPLVHHP